ncbi:MAG: hypothetical protein M3Q30_14120, partial [Actinomycetota bacterium]|nr:hypothetical protein [Actinomycetota bacterium]
MKTRQGATWRRRLVGFVLAVPFAILGIVVVYAIASFADGSLADVSGPVEAAILAGVAVVLLVCRWLLSREGSTSSSGVTERTISGGGD